MTICLASLSSSPTHSSFTTQTREGKLPSSSSSSSISYFLADDASSSPQQSDDGLSLEWMSWYLDKLQSKIGTKKRETEEGEEREGMGGKLKSEGDGREENLVDDWEALLDSSEDVTQKSSDGKLLTSSDGTQSYTWDAFLSLGPLSFPCEYVKDRSLYAPHSIEEDFSVNLYQGHCDAMIHFLRDLISPNSLSNPQISEDIPISRPPPIFHSQFHGSGSLSRWSLSPSAASLLEASTSAGCGFSCRVSEALSCEVFLRVFGAELTLREKEVGN